MSDHDPAKTQSLLTERTLEEVCSTDLLRASNAAVHHSPENRGAGLPRPNKGLVRKNRKELVRNTLYLTPRTRQHRPSETKVYKAPCKYARFTATDRVDIWTATGCLLAWAKCITATRTSVRPRPSQKRRLGRPLQQQWIGCLNLGINTQTRNWLDVWHSTGL